MSRPAPVPQMRTSREQFSPTTSPVGASYRRLTGSIEPHGHDFLKVAVVAEGTGVHESSAGSTAFGPGAVFVLRPGAWHRYVDCDGLVVGHLTVSADSLRGDFALIRGVPEVRRLLWTGPVVAGRRGVLSTSVPPAVAQQAFAEIMTLRDELSDGPANRSVLMARVLLIVALLADAADLGRDTGTTTPAVSRALHLLEGEPERRWTMEALAADVGLAPGYLSRSFRAQVGTSPLDHLARLRAERAVVLLARTDLPVAAVGVAVGWSDPNYFARRFRSLYGLAPREYRRRVRRGDDPVDSDLDIRQDPLAER